MKRFTISILLLAVICYASVSCSQSRQTEVKLESIDSLLQKNNALLQQLEIDLSLKKRFKIYKTENLYNVLELDTKTGKIYQVQWSLETKTEFSIILNSVDLRTEESKGSGTFELYPTGNMYQFLLLDKTDGRTWHVQWGLDDDHRWIRPIL